MHNGLATEGLSATQAFGSAFPSRSPILSNGCPAGGSTDIASRLIIEGMAEELDGYRVVVENRPGASGTVAATWLTRQQPDGCSLLLSESSSFAIWPAMHETGVKYDPVRDFDWVVTVCTAPMVLIVSPNFPARTAQEAIALLGSAGERSTFQCLSTSAATFAWGVRACEGSFVRSERRYSRFPTTVRRSLGTALRNQ